MLGGILLRKIPTTPGRPAMGRPALVRRLVCRAAGVYPDGACRVGLSPSLTSRDRRVVGFMPRSRAAPSDP
jgi:hypothetical protein